MWFTLVEKPPLGNSLKAATQLISSKTTVSNNPSLDLERSLPTTANLLQLQDYDSNDTSSVARAAILRPRKRRGGWDYSREVSSNGSYPSRR